MRVRAAVALIACVSGCSGTQTATTRGADQPVARTASPETSLGFATDPQTGPIEAFPFVRVNRAERIVEFDAFVPIDCHDPATPIVYLEVIACAVDTKEHESLAATHATPSNIHAALLLAGLEPGEPGRWSWEESLQRHPPTGPALDVFLVIRDSNGAEQETLATDWIINAETGERLTEHLDTNSPLWVFSGSRFVEHEGAEFYDADGTGVIVGLHTFGSEVVGLREVMSHDSGVTEPEWIADADVVPRFGTEVVVRIKAR